jgi:hypothetical protein
VKTAAGLFLALLLAIASPAHALLFSQASGAGVTITGVTLSATAFPGGSAANTSVATITVNTTGGAFTGTLALGTAGSADYANFAISGSTLSTYSGGTVATGSYDLNIVPTMAGAVNSGTAYPVIVNGTGTQYYLSSASGNTSGWGNGSDSNNGTSTSTPWLSPNHALNCGDKISVAAATNYSSTNFASGKWGAVTCSGNPNKSSALNVAWLQCVTFAACTGTNFIINPSASYWGVAGFVVTYAGTSGGYCMYAAPPTSSTTIHHIIIFNNVVTNCGDGITEGLYAGATGPAGVDYWVNIANAVYNAAASSVECFSGLSPNTPVASDSNSGTHYYFAYNIVWGNVAPNPCGGSNPGTDGEGIIFDTWHGNGGTVPVYTQQAVLEDSIFVGNGSAGVEIFNQGETSGGSTSTIIVRHNTLAENFTSTTLAGSGATYGEFWTNSSVGAGTIRHITFQNNIVQPAASTCCASGAGTVYGGQLVDADSTVAINNNYSFAGASGCGGCTGNFNSTSSSGVTFSGNTFSAPAFVSTTVPGAPSCSGATNTLSCTQAAAIIANFTPTTSGALSDGYQAPAGLTATDALFPAWLCNVTWPDTTILSLRCN